MSELTKTLMADHRAFHSAFQIDRFIIGKSGTPWGQYQQALREIDTREGSIVEDELQIAELEHEIEKGKPHASKIARIRHEANLKRLERARRRLNEKRAELARFVGIATILKAYFGDVDEAQRDRLDAELWEYRLRMRAAIDFAIARTVSHETIELMLACPIDMRLRLMREIKDAEKLEAWAMDHEPKLIATAMERTEVEP